MFALSVCRHSARELLKGVCLSKHEIYNVRFLFDFVFRNIFHEFSKSFILKNINEALVIIEYRAVVHRLIQGAARVHADNEVARRCHQPDRRPGLAFLSLNLLIGENIRS